LHYATRGCELNDALGCYNAACYQCKLSHPQEALNAFKQSIDMYFSDPNVQVGPSSPEKDPDLDCIRNNQDFEKTLKRYRSAPKL